MNILRQQNVADSYPTFPVLCALLSGLKISAPTVQADVECEYGFEFVDSECVPMPDLDPKQCPILKENGGSYRTSSTHRRLVSGDLCSNVTLVIADTDGAGGLPLPPVNPSGGGGGHGGHSGWFTFFMVLLVRPCLLNPRRRSFEV